MNPLSGKTVAAIGAWVSLVAYAGLMGGFLADAWDLPATATTAPVLDGTLTGYAAGFGAAVIGVIAGLTGVSVAKATGLMSAPARLSDFLVGGPSKGIGKWAGPTYLVGYFAIAVISGVVVFKHGSDLTPDFIKTELAAAVGLIGAMAAVSRAAN